MTTKMLVEIRKVAMLLVRFCDYTFKLDRNIHEGDLRQ